MALCRKTALVSYTSIKAERSLCQAEQNKPRSQTGPLQTDGTSADRRDLCRQTGPPQTAPGLEGAPRQVRGKAARRHSGHTPTSDGTRASQVQVPRGILTLQFGASNISKCSLGESRWPTQCPRRR